METKKYQPISCHFYDELEALATLRKKVSIQFFDENNSESIIEDMIVDFQIMEEAEHMLLKSGRLIRLDRLIQVDGKALNGFC